MKKETVSIGGKQVPLTKNGLPNKVYLSKDEREVLESFEKEIKKQKKEVKIKELTDVLNKLKK
jgi:hypothetical protein